MVEVIEIEIKGNVQTGKSAIAASIGDMLRNFGYCVAVLDPAERNNPSRSLATAAEHEKPSKTGTILSIVETTDCGHSTTIREMEWALRQIRGWREIDRNTLAERLASIEEIVSDVLHKTGRE